MNNAKLYSQAVGRVSPDGIPEDENLPELNQSEQINEDAARKQAKYQWLSSTITQEYLKQVHTEYESLVDLAIKNAASYHNHQNHYQIISILIRANELKKIIQEQQK